MNSISTYNTQPAFGRPAPTDPANPTHAGTSMQAGRAVFENDNYHVSVGNEGSVSISNKHTGETYDVWGDPHVNIDGEHAFDFRGTTTLTLEDGTKVTLDTRPMADDPSSTQTSRVTITNGGYGVQVEGVDGNGTGALTINETQQWGGLLDAVVADGNPIQENPAGEGFLAVDEQGKIHAVDQTYIDASELRQAGEHVSPLAQAFEALGTLISICLRGYFTPAQGGPDQGSPSWAPSIGGQAPGTQTGPGVDLTSSASGRTAPATEGAADTDAAGHPILPDPLGVGSKENQADHDPVEHALDPIGLF